MSTIKLPVRRFEASVSYRDGEGRDEEQVFPVLTSDFQQANRLAFAYVLEVLRLSEFELRLVGS